MVLTNSAGAMDFVHHNEPDFRVSVGVTQRKEKVAK